MRRARSASRGRVTLARLQMMLRVNFERKESLLGHVHFVVFIIFSRDFRSSAFVKMDNWTALCHMSLVLSLFMLAWVLTDVVQSPFFLLDPWNNWIMALVLELPKLLCIIFYQKFQEREIWVSSLPYTWISHYPNALRSLVPYFIILHNQKSRISQRKEKKHSPY